MNISDIDQVKLQEMVVEAQATSATYNAMSDRMFQLQNLIPSAKKNLEIEQSNQLAAHPAFPDVPASMRKNLTDAEAQNIGPIPAQDFSKRVEAAKQRLGQLLEEKENLPARMSKVGEKNIRLATTLREINRSLMASGIKVACMESYT